MEIGLKSASDRMRLMRRHLHLEFALGRFGWVGLEIAEIAVRKALFWDKKSLPRAGQAAVGEALALVSLVVSSYLFIYFVVAVGRKFGSALGHFSRAPWAVLFYREREQGQARPGHGAFKRSDSSRGVARGADGRCPNEMFE